jgi:hypothetical protein
MLFARYCCSQQRRTPRCCRPRGTEATHRGLRKEARTSPGFGRSRRHRRRPRRPFRRLAAAADEAHRRSRQLCFELLRDFTGLPHGSNTSTLPRGVDCGPRRPSTSPRVAAARRLDASGEGERHGSPDQVRASGVPGRPERSSRQSMARDQRSARRPNPLGAAIEISRGDQPLGSGQTFAGSRQPCTTPEARTSPGFSSCGDSLPGRQRPRGGGPNRCGRKG